MGLRSISVELALVENLHVFQKKYGSVSGKCVFPRSSRGRREAAIRTTRGLLGHRRHYVHTVGSTGVTTTTDAYVDDVKHVL